MIRSQLLRGRLPHGCGPSSQRLASALARQPIASPSSSAPQRLRSKWRRIAVAGASMWLLWGLTPGDVTASHPFNRQWLFLRSGWMLSSAFIAYTNVRRDLFGGDDGLDDDARAALRIQWWEAIQRSERAREGLDPSSVLDRMVRVVLDLMAPNASEESSSHDDRAHLIRVLVERGAVELLVDYLAETKPTDPELVEKIRQCIEIGFDNTTQDTTTAHCLQLSTVTLGLALGHIVETAMPRSGDMVQLGQILLLFERLSMEAEAAASSTGSSFTTPRRLDEAFGQAVHCYLRLLSPEMPTSTKEFALLALANMAQTAARLPECGSTRQLDALLSPMCATLLAALPRSSEQLQSRAAGLMSVLIQVSQALSVPVHEDVYDHWMHLVRAWANPATSSGLRLASASCLRMLSSHPRTRHFVRDSSDTMETLYLLSRHIHETQVQPPGRRKGTRNQAKKVMAVPGLPNVYDQVEQALIQKELSKAFLNVCTSSKSGGTAILETMSSKSSKSGLFHSKRTLPMSEVFRTTQDLMDLPVYGADEYDASTEFGWIDILTHWTGSSDRDIRRNAIDSLVYLVEQDSETLEGTQTQRHLLQAWLTSMLQHVRNVTGGEEILAIKQVEEIARISDDFTPGNEQVLFNPAVVDAGASALAILAEQHYDELVHFGVVQLMSLLAMKCPSDSRFDFATQSARVVANLVAACSKTLEKHQPRPDHDGHVVLELANSSPVVEDFGLKYSLWKTFFGEVFDVGQLLEASSSGQQLLQVLRSWKERDDPYQRSQLFRALNNMAAYRELARTGTRTIPIYAEGVHPIVPHGTDTNDVSTPETSDVDVVFVHGLRGDAFGTWRTDMSDAIDARTDVWPDILLHEDLKNHGIRARVISLGYEAGMVSWSSPWPSLTLQERAKLMLEALYAADIGRNCVDGAPRPVVFVTHSMGGILVKKMLLQSKVSQEQSKSLPLLADTTQGVVFLAVPHFGSDLARGARSEAVRSLLRTHPAIQDLCSSHDRRLENLNDSFAELHIDCLSIAEQKPAPLGFGLSAMVVKPESANPGIGDFFVLPNADHMTICKAKNHDDPMYRSVLDYVLDHINKRKSLQ